ncbi:hypothetical protein M8J77_015981 [Diaphorina citri]|nr:hypothetical protein M8J77_015981 [Diaphorina citri]
MQKKKKRRKKKEEEEEEKLKKRRRRRRRKKKKKKKKMQKEEEKKEEEEARNEIGELWRNCLMSAGAGGPGPPMDLAPGGPLSHLHLLNHDVMTGGPVTGVASHSPDVLLALLARNKSLEEKKLLPGYRVYLYRVSRERLYNA